MLIAEAASRMAETPIGLASSRRGVARGIACQVDRTASGRYAA
jgi:hypothetical protein